MSESSEQSWLTTSIARHIWETKYRWVKSGEPRDSNIEATWRRVARAVASVESLQRQAWEERFYSILRGFRFLPAGRILAGAGTGRRVTLFNCFVMGLMDNVIDCSQFPLEAQELQATGSRRIGLGITGLADALIMLGLHYGTEEARTEAGCIMRTICHTAYRASIQLAGEKTPFPFFDQDAYLESGFLRSLPQEIREGIAQHGIRNSHLTAIAPTGTISLLAGNISSGVEPVFDFQFSRKVLNRKGVYDRFDLEDYAFRRWRKLLGESRDLPDQFVHARTLPPTAHLQMQAALQPYVDSAISKTINVPEGYSFDDFQDLYQSAYHHGLKGCTTFRPNPVTGKILDSAADAGQ